VLIHARLRHGNHTQAADEVRDAKTGEDVTSAILTQIVLEEARKKKYLLPPPLLYLIIQYGENVLTDFFEKYLEQTIRNYLLLRNMADDQFKKWLAYGENASRTNSPPLGGLASFQSLFDLFSAASPDKKEKKRNNGAARRAEKGRGRTPRQTICRFSFYFIVFVCPFCGTLP
jgi:hypothetical protein